MGTTAICQKCRRAATTTVTVAFTPGGVETLHLCDDHTLEYYAIMVGWFGQGVRMIPDYLKTTAWDAAARVKEDGRTSAGWTG